MTTTSSDTTRKPSPKTEARRKRDDAFRALGETVYRAWLARDRQSPGALEVEAGLKAIDAAVTDVALQA